MTESATDREPIDAVAEEFLRRYREGETPSIEDYARRYPELAEEIRELLPTVVELEGLKRRHEQRDIALPAPCTLPVQQLGDFRLVREIGRGGMGIVYEAEQVSLGRRVAVKILPKQSLLKPKQLARFEREAKTAAKLHHTHIVPVFGVGEDEGYHFIVMQLIPGVGLDEVIAEIRHMDGDPSINTAESDHPPGYDRPASSVARSLLAWKSTDDVASASSDWSATKTLAGSPERCVSDLDVDDKTVETRIVPAPDDFGISEELAVSNASKRSSSGKILGPDYWQSVARIGRDAALALAYAHQQGTLHRDVKPGNLLVDVHGEVWVADFGLAKMAEGEQISQTGDIVGTLRYMPPEQLRNQADARSDVYSLGLTLYELVTLQPAFDQTACRQALVRDGEFGQAPRPGKLIPHVPRDLETIILKAMEPEPERRYASATDMAADLDRFLVDLPIHARRINVIERLWRWSRRNQGIAFLSTVSMLLLITVAVVSYVGYVRSKSARLLAEQQATDEKRERKRAEETLTTSLQALDAVFRRFAPERRIIDLDSGPQQDDEDGPAPVSPVLAPEHAKFLEEILVFYDKLASHGGKNRKLREEAAKANRRVGDIHRRLGNFPRAEAAYQRSSGKYRELLDDSNSDSDERRIAFELARIENDLGAVYRTLHKHEESRKSFDSARRRLTELARRTNAPEARFELARTYLYLAVRSTGAQAGSGMPGGPPGKSRPGGAGRRSRGRFRQKRGGMRRRFDPNGGGPAGGPGRRFRGGRPAGGRGFAKQDDPDHFFDRRRRRSFRPFGRHHDHPQSRKDLDSAVSILEILYRDYPRVGDYQHLLAITLRERGGKPNTLDYRRAVQLLEDLTRRFPQQPDYQYALIEIWSRASEPYWGMTENDIRQAEKRLRRAVKSAVHLTSRHINVPDYAHSHATAIFRLAIVLERKSRDTKDHTERRKSNDEAGTLFRKAESVQSKLVARFPDARPYAGWLAKYRMMLVRFLVMNGQTTEARKVLTSLEDLRKKSPEDDPGRRFFDGGLRAVYYMLARRLRENGDSQAARELLQKAREFRGGRSSR